MGTTKSPLRSVQGFWWCPYDYGSGYCTYCLMTKTAAPGRGAGLKLFFCLTGYNITKAVPCRNGKQAILLRPGKKMINALLKLRTGNA